MPVDRLGLPLRLVLLRGLRLGTAAVGRHRGGLGPRGVVVLRCDVLRCGVLRRRVARRGVLRRGRRGLGVVVEPDQGRLGAQEQLGPLRGEHRGLRGLLRGGLGRHRLPVLGVTLGVGVGVGLALGVRLVRGVDRSSHSLGVVRLGNVVLELQLHVRRGLVVVRRNRWQRARGFRGLYLQQAAALQGARALGLGRGVPAQQGRVFIAQARQLRALGAQLVLQLDAEFARLVEVGLKLGEPLLVAPLVARTRAYQVSHLFARLCVPAAHERRADERGRGGDRRDYAERRRLREDPGPEGADERHACDRRGGNSRCNGGEWR